LSIGPLTNSTFDTRARTVSTSTTTGRMLPVAGTGSGTVPGVGASASVSVGEQASDTTTDVWGVRGELSRFERSNLVTVRVRVDYDLTFRRTTVDDDGAVHLEGAPTYAATTGEAYISLHEDDYQALVAQQAASQPAVTPAAAPHTVVHSPEVEDTRYVADGPVNPDGLSPTLVLRSAISTRESDHGGLITGDPDP
jgi:hypothetical protein